MVDALWLSVVQGINRKYLIGDTCEIRRIHGQDQR